jgi:thioredoxin family protein
MAQLTVPKLDAKRFATGMSWKDYMAQMGDNRARTEENYSKTKLTDDEKKFFGGLNQVKYALMLAENWCGDVHRNSPLLAHICEAIPGCELRVFLRDQNFDITDAYLNNGYRSIPVIVFFDKDWNEIGHWIERSGPATAKMHALRAKTVDAAPPDKDKQDAAMNEFRTQYMALHDGPNSLWREAVKEVKSILETRLGLVGAADRK